MSWDPPKSDPIEDIQRAIAESWLGAAPPVGFARCCTYCGVDVPGFLLLCKPCLASLRPPPKGE